MLVKLLLPPRRLRLVLMVLCLCIPFLASLQNTESRLANGRRASSVTVPQTSNDPPAPVAVTNPAVGGQWELNASGGVKLKTWPNIPVHASVLPDGRVIFWGRDKNPGTTDDVKGRTQVDIWRPHYDEDADAFALPNHPSKNNTQTNLFCSGHSFLQDGRLLVTGGQGDTLFPNKSIDAEGSSHINIFDYRTNSWSRLQKPDGTGPQNMLKGRWYPYNLTLPDGRVVIISGSYWRSTSGGGGFAPNNIPEVLDLDGGLTEMQSTIEGFSLTDSKQNKINNYPKINLDPRGNLFLATAIGTTNLSTTQSHENISRIMTIEGNKGFWTSFSTDLPSGFADLATTALYEQGKVLIMGGRGTRNGIEDSPMNGALTVDLNPASGWTWQQTGNMRFNRIYHTATLLPDGKVLVTGGTQCPGTNNVGCTNGKVRNPEMWDPQTGNWTVMAMGSDVPRVYHSVALLLPDGRVLVGGGGRPTALDEPGAGPNGAHMNVEIFSPPYLFDDNGTPVTRRPNITQLPERIVYNQEFEVGVGTVESGDIDSAVLVRLPSVTHQFNQDQRRVSLRLAGTPRPNERTLRLIAPTDGKECPPGVYMMFLMKKTGPGQSRMVPSRAKMITVGNLALDRNSHAFAAQIGDAPASSRQISVKTAPAPDGTPVQWRAKVLPSGTDWLTITPTTSHTGDGTINFTLTNNTGAARQAVIRVEVVGQRLVSQEFTVYQARNFTDVPAVFANNLPNPFYQVISKLSARRITGGCNDGTTFCPSNQTTRGQMAVFLVTAMGISTPEIITSKPFPDIETSHGAARFIKELLMRKVVTGFEDGNYHPDDPVTRGQMAVFIIASLGITPPDVPSEEQIFNDVKGSHPFGKFIKEMKVRGITAGDAQGNFNPDAVVTREQMAAFIVAAFNL